MPHSLSWAIHHFKISRVQFVSRDLKQLQSYGGKNSNILFQELQEKPGTALALRGWRPRAVGATPRYNDGKPSTSQEILREIQSGSGDTIATKVEPPETQQQSGNRLPYWKSNLPTTWGDLEYNIFLCFRDLLPLTSFVHLQSKWKGCWMSWLAVTEVTEKEEVVMFPELLVLVCCVLWVMYLPGFV